VTLLNRMKKRYVPYPFQNNIVALPQEDQIDCINGLIDAKVANEMASSPPANFDEWIMRVMGKGLANIFMRPYNFKVWAIPTQLMQCSWLGERVATANVARVVENVIRCPSSFYPSLLPPLSTDLLGSGTASRAAGAPMPSSASLRRAAPEPSGRRWRLCFRSRRSDSTPRSLPFSLSPSV
jgi:hypothetical protein